MVLRSTLATRSEERRKERGVWWERETEFVHTNEEERRAKHGGVKGNNNKQIKQSNKENSNKNNHERNRPSEFLGRK